MTNTAVDPSVGRDLSEFQDPLAIKDQYKTFGYAIIRASHGKTPDLHWEEHVYNMGVVQRPIGLYHTLESGDVVGEAKFFRDLIAGVTHDHGDWLDLARGDVNPALINLATLDAFRSIIDAGWYCNLSALNMVPEYKRFERLWVADPSPDPPPTRWLMWQKGQGFGIDIDKAADLGGVIRPNWAAFDFPNA
jgi:hypothetical protein